MRRTIGWASASVLPANWQVVPVKRTGVVTLGKMLQSDAKDDEETLVPYLRAANVQPDGLLAIDDTKQMWFTKSERVTLTLCVGDVVVVEGGIGGYGRAAYVPDDRLEGWGFQNSINRIRPHSDNDGRFLAYALLAVRSTGFIEVYCNVVSMPHLTAEKLSRLDVPLPLLDEQRAIADHLDVETARIDALVAKQEQFIRLLRERRQAAIRIATGWGRSLPDGWTIARLSHLFRSTGSGTTPTNEEVVDSVVGDVAWVTTSELRESQIEGTRRAVSFSTLEKYSALKVYPTGTLLLAMYGATIGRTGLLGVPAATNQACCALIESVGTSANFVEYSLIAAREWLLLEASGGGQPNINQDKVRAFRIPLPPLDEQQSILNELDDQTLRIDTLIAKAEEHISLAKERRSALITAAVTGQIDVRTARKAS